MAERITAVQKAIEQALRASLNRVSGNLQWLFANMPPYFFITMHDEQEAIINLTQRLTDVAGQTRVTLTDRANKLIVARLDIPGSLYDTVRHIQEREISYAELIHSYEHVPGADRALEILRFEFERKPHEEILRSCDVEISPEARTAVRHAMKRMYPSYDFKNLNDSICLLLRNNDSYVRISPPDRIARALWLFEQSTNDGLYLDMETVEGVSRRRVEYRLLFSVANPPEKGFLSQISEVFQRLGLGVQRSYALNISTGSQRHFLGTFYIVPHDGTSLRKDSGLFQKLQTELYNTQILSTGSETYAEFVTRGIMGGEGASLTDAFIAFCHTTLAHNQPDRFSLARVKGAFYADPETTHKLIRLFNLRFDKEFKKNRREFEDAFEEARRLIEGYNTGYRYLDKIRRSIFLTCLLFIRHVLKTNFFVPQKHALAFRLDPSYLKELPPDFTSDLPREAPFRVSFFFGRYGMGYHIGFSDIARGGWRTVVCTSADSYLTNVNTLFREVFTLAHTQHLKNKDIYEGGSKMTVVLDAEECASADEVNHRLFKLQYGFINAFLDIFVTENGRVKNPLVVDYYGEDEPIEMGPDENMHDAMIELIAQHAVKRGYLLGAGIISSKRAGISHRRYGVTSRGVVKFAEIAMRELGVDMRRGPFTVKMTGGTNGDVAGNAMRLLFKRFPRTRILSVVDGSGGVYDPGGISHNALKKLLMKESVVSIDPNALHPGGFVVFRAEYRQDRLRRLHRKLVRTRTSVAEEWLTTDDFHREEENLIFGVSADLFLPCGGRPETIDETNWQKLFSADGAPTARAIVEGANAFITPEARKEIQKRGVVILRDASANKCGVIASSYEIIANLLLTEREFLKHKGQYVRSVFKILDKRAEEEANLIFERFREGGEKILYTDITNRISREINGYYSRLVAFFQERPELTEQKAFQRVLMNHLPGFIRDNRRYRARVKGLPQKIKTAMLASEIASSIVYRGGWEMPFEDKLERFVKQRDGRSFY